MNSEEFQMIERLTLAVESIARSLHELSLVHGSGVLDRESELGSGRQEQ